MAFAETANLAVKLTLGGNFTSQISKAQGSFSKLNRQIDSTQGRAYKAGTQIGVGIKRAAVLAVASLGTLATAIGYAVKQGQDAANVQKVYANAIANSYKGAADATAVYQAKLAKFQKAQKSAKPGSTAAKNLAQEIKDLKAQQASIGPVTAQYTAILNAQQTALMNLAGVDDELIKTEQTRLIQMGFSGKATAALTPLILDASKATGKDLLTVTVAAGKAANGNATALQRLGIMVDKARFKINPLAETMRVLNQRFGGTTKALSGSFDTRLAALRENLNNIAEDAGQKLLPVLTRIVDVVGKNLVPALGKAIDRLLPTVIDNLNQFADALSSGKAEEAIRGITDAIGPMVDLIKIAAAPVKAIVSAFLSLPKEVQTVLIAGFAVNKLTGGLVTNVAGGIVESIGKALLGGIKAPLVNVEGAVVNVNGGIPGLPGGGGLPEDATKAAGAAGGLSVLGTLGLLTAAGAASGFAFANLQHGAGARPGAFTPTIGGAFAPQKIDSNDPFWARLKTSLATINATNKSGSPDDRQAKNDKLAASAAVALKAAAARDKEASAAIRAAVKAAQKHVQARAKTILATGAAHDRETSASIRTLVTVAAPKVTNNVNVKVSVTAAGIHKTVAFASRYGPSGGSRIATTANGGTFALTPGA